jgi:archaellum component FlaC
MEDEIRKRFDTIIEVLCQIREQLNPALKGKFAGITKTQLGELKERLEALEKKLP